MYSITREELLKQILTTAIDEKLDSRGAVSNFLLKAVCI